MKRGLEWYKREPQAIRMAMMAARMTTAQAAVYSLVIDLIYEGGGETPNEPQHIAAHFADMGTAKARKTVDELIAMGKLFVVEGMLHEKRAEIEAKTRRKVSENRAESGRKGGISSGVSRAAANKNNDIDEANASSKNEAEREREREREVVVAGRADAPAIQPALSAEEPDLGQLLGQVMAAVGLNPNDIPSAHWMPNVAERHLLGWLNAGIPPDVIVRIARESRQRHQAPPNGPKALDGAMRAWLTAQSAPAFTAPVIPISTGPQDARRPARQSRGDATLDAFLSGARG